MSEPKISGNVQLDEDTLMELQYQLGTYYTHAIGYHEGELGIRVRNGWEYYYGNLPEPVTLGASKWVDRSVWEAVNGVQQELTSVFTSGEKAVRFAPMHSKDANAAMAATEMVNKILLRDNPGYNALGDAFKECLVARNSFIKRYWKTEINTYTEEFEDLTKEELDTYLMELEGEITEFTTEGEKDEETGEEKFSGQVTYEVTKEGVKVEYVPFEEVIIEPTARSLKDSNYIAHRVRKSKDELLLMGFDPEMVESLNPASSDIEAGVIANSRVNNLNPLNVSDVLSVGDEFADKLWLHENYLKTSLLGGRTEILQIFSVNQQILEVNRVNEFPFETFTPFPIPGSIWGESVYDITKDIQDLNTSLIRGMIDNIMNANFRRYQAVKGQFDRESLLNNRPGGVIEVMSQGAVTPFPYHQLPQGIDGLLEYINSKKEERTGVSKVGQGLDPNVFKNDNSTATVNMVMTAAQNRLRMIARNIAQSGMMNLMLSIYNLVRMNGKEKIVIETANGMVELDPTKLPPRNEMIVAVAVGDGERRERAQALQSVLMSMTQVPQLQQFLQPNNAYYLATQMFESMGIYDIENYITPLDKLPPPQPDPMQELTIQQMQEQIKQIGVQTQKLISDVQNESRRAEFEQMKAADEISLRREESRSSQDEMAERMSLEERKMELEAMRIQLEKEKIELKRQEMLIEAQIEARQGRAVSIGR
ncbi:portal protein [Aeromonas phage BUCT695]|uniref:portal protein n=1 Tax=Aeromonas phage BUCT695 TaxID=2908630 RepID=UPI0023294364|nr:portal protein [Aeromonas phage BUCT695]UIW10601.1 portal protein [Aeromonas phage BUCT695]